MTTTPQWAKDAADAVFGELADRSGFDHWWGNIGEDTSNEILDAVAASIAAAAPPHPAAASVRARGLVWTVDTEDGFESHTAEVNAPNINYFEVGPSQKGFYAKAEHSQDRDATWYGTQFPSIEAAKAACYEAWNAYVRSLLVPVDEAAVVLPYGYTLTLHASGNWYYAVGDHASADYWPSRVTAAFRAWEHYERQQSRAAPLTESAEAPVAWIPKCDFDGMATGRVGRAFGPQPDLLKSRDNCVPVYTHPAPLPTVAGVTEAMVEAFEAKFLECARTRPDSTLRDDMRAALVAALGARKGE